MSSASFNVGGVTSRADYGYDELDRLETVDYSPDDAYPSGLSVAYEYERAGNRERETFTGSSLSIERIGQFNGLGQITQLDQTSAGEPPVSTTFGWDDFGNLTSRAVGGVTTSYLYDPTDALVEIQQGGSIPGSFQYDGLGRRSLKVGADGIRQYVYDGTSVLGELNEIGVPVVANYYAGIQPLGATVFVAGESYRLSYGHDALGSVTTVMNDAAAITAHYRLDPWGGLRFPADMNPADQVARQNRFAFTGHYWDKEVGLYYAKARYLDPMLGMFTSPDPFPGVLGMPASLHPYAYAHSRPTYYVDPSGQWVEDLVIGIPSIALGLYTLRHNIKEGNWGAAAIDSLGIVADAAAIALPVVPGGVGLAIKGVRAARAARTIRAGGRSYEALRLGIRGLQALDRAVNVGQGIGATAELYAEGRTGWAVGVGALTAFGIVGTRQATRELVGAFEDIGRTSRSGSLLRALNEQYQLKTPKPGAVASTFGAGQFPRIVKNVPAPSRGPIAYGTPYRQLHSRQVARLKTKIADRTITRAEWKWLQWHERLQARRQRGIDAFWAAERQRLRTGQQPSQCQVSNCHIHASPNNNGKVEKGSGLVLTYLASR